MLVPFALAARWLELRAWISVVCVLRVVRYRSTPRLDRSTGVQSNAVCLGVIEKLTEETCARARGCPNCL